MLINDSLKDVEEAGLGIEVSSGKRIGGMLCADDFEGVSESRESLQKLIDVVYRYCNRWRLKGVTEKLRKCLADRYVNFDKLNSVEKTAYVL